MSDKFDTSRSARRRHLRHEPAVQVPHHRPRRRDVPSGVWRATSGLLPGNAQYTCWLDDRGFVNEDGVILRPANDEFLLTSAEPNLAYFADRIGRHDVRSRTSARTSAPSRSRGRAAATCSRRSCHRWSTSGISASPRRDRWGKGDRQPHGYSGDLGYEIWIDQPDALHVWDTLWESVDGHGVLPFGLAALYMLRIEAGLSSSKPTSTPAATPGTTPIDRRRSSRLGWMFKDLKTRRRAFIGRRRSTRDHGQDIEWAMRGLIVDWRDYDRSTTRRA